MLHLCLSSPQEVVSRVERGYRNYVVARARYVVARARYTVAMLVVAGYRDYVISYTDREATVVETVPLFNRLTTSI